MPLTLLPGSAGRSEGQEATLSNTSARGDSDNVAALGRVEGNTLPFFRLHTDGKLSLRQERARRPKDRCWVKWGLAQSCSLTISIFTGIAKEKAKGEVLPWFPSTPQDSAVPSQTLQPNRGVRRPHIDVNSKFSQETALQLSPKLMSSPRGLEKSLTFG